MLSIKHRLYYVFAVQAVLFFAVNILCFYKLIAIPCAVDTYCLTETEKIFFSTSSIFRINVE